MLMREPIGRDEIRYKNIPDLVTVLVALNWVANLAGPKDAIGALVGAVQPGVHRHLAELVRSSNAHGGAVCHQRLHKYLGDRESVIRQIVVCERASLIAVIQK